MVMSPYSMQELDALIGLYLELKANHVGNFAQLRLMDIDRALMLISMEDRTFVFLRGICNMTSREAGSILSVHHSTVLDRYSRAKDLLFSLMNGEDES